MNSKPRAFARRPIQGVGRKDSDYGATAPACQITRPLLNHQQRPAQLPESLFELADRVRIGGLGHDQQALPG